MQKLRQLTAPRAYFPHLVDLRDGVQILAHMVCAATGRADDVLVAPKVLDEQRLHQRRVGLVAAVGQGLAAAGLIQWIVHLHPDALQGLERGYADLGEECFNEAGNEQRDLHLAFYLEPQGPARMDVGYSQL